MKNASRAPKQRPHPRPFATYYYAAVRDADKDWSRIGHAGSIRGAVRAAVGHIIDHKYSACVIYDMDNKGEFAARVFRRGGSIIVIGA